MRPSLAQQFQPNLGALNIQKVSMRKALGQSRPAINRDPHVHHVGNPLEELAEILVRHVEGHVAEVQRSRRIPDPHMGIDVVLRKLDRHATALEDLQVHALNGAGGGLDGIKLDVAEPVKNTVSIPRTLTNNNGERKDRKRKGQRKDSPLANPPIITNNINLLYNPKLLHSPTHILRRNVKEQIPHKHRLLRLRHPLQLAEHLHVPRTPRVRLVIEGPIVPPLRSRLEAHRIVVRVARRKAVLRV